MDSKIKTIHHAYQAGKTSCVEFIREILSLLNANTPDTVHLLFEDYALEQAQKVDQKIKSGETIGLLEGIPFGISDTILLQNSITSGNSSFLNQYVAPYTATAVNQLIKAGAIPVVKEKGDCFGHGHRNSGAIHVANGFTTFSVGGDIGCSILQLADRCNVFGMKPTYGRISRFGLMADASSLDCIGMLATSLEDIRILLNTMSGKDPHDMTTYASADIPENVFNSGEIKTVGYYKNDLDDDFLDVPLKNDFQKMLDTLSLHKITVVPLDFFDLDVVSAALYVLEMAETSSNLARLDGSLYGVRSTNSADKESYLKMRADNFSEETKLRIIGGSLASSRGFEDIYRKAKEMQNAVIARINSDFQSVDVILSPVCRDARPCECRDARPCVSTLGGLPSLTVPCAKLNGIKIIANKRREDRILHAAHVLKEFL